MSTNYKNCKWQLWLTRILATGGVWTYFGSSTFAQNAGTITVDTGNLIVRDGGSLSSESSGSAGTLTINTGSLTVHGASISVNSSRVPIADNIAVFSNGGSLNLGGNITIGATDSVLISPSGNLAIANDALLTAVNNGSGNAGDITIRVRDSVLTSPGGNLAIGDGALIGVSPSNPVLSAGGNISITTTGIIITRRVPEPDSTLGLLAFAVVSAASIHKFKQKSKVVF